MKAVRIHAPGDLRIEELLAATVQPDEVAVAVRIGGVCGSDLHYFRHGGFGSVRLRAPMILGHEVAGVITEAGASVVGLASGDRVAVNPSLACGTCRFCRAGADNLCRDMRFFGSAMRFPHVEGGFRTTLVCKASQAVVLPEGLGFGAAAFAEPLAVCVHAIGRAGPLDGRRVLVTGAGPIGALTALAARHAGAEVVVADIAPEPLTLLAGLGLETALSPAPDGVSAWSRAHGPVDCAFEASGASAALQLALANLEPAGVVVQIGLGEAMTLPLGPLVTMEVDLRGSFRFRTDEFRRALKLLAAQSIEVTPLLSKVFPMDDAVAAFDFAADRRRSMKVQLSFPT